MQIVIDIPEKVYSFITTECNDVTISENEAPFEYIIRGIIDGTVLPKKYGRLIDADETLKAMDTWDKFGYTEAGRMIRNPGDDYVPYVHYEDMVKAVNGTPTVIEADKGGKR